MASPPTDDSGKHDMHRSDLKLASQVLSGDERAFDRFFGENFPGLYRFALLRVDRHEDAAEEVAQATLCKAIDKLGTYRGEAALFTWLCTLCRHEISAYYGKRERPASRVDLVEDNPEVRAALESLGAAQDGPEQSLGRSEIARLVQVTLDRLPARYGAALELKYMEELSVKDIAERLDLTPKAAESLLTRAREAFRDGFLVVSRQGVGS